MVEWEQQFFERRTTAGKPAAGRERRQFADAHDDLPPELREFANAVDAYKIAHARKFVTLAELHAIFTGLGYHK